MTQKQVSYIVLHFLLDFYHLSSSRSAFSLERCRALYRISVFIEIVLVCCDYTLLYISLVTSSLSLSLGVP